ncbi:MAG: hypothetical protein GXP55_18480 [Deltaproteobacteria bacterium]|nr:hypothetical protein [Deltaproteobacteria bacterium]
MSLSRLRFARPALLLPLLFAIACPHQSTGTAHAPNMDDLRTRAAAHPQDASLWRQLALAELYANGGDASRARPAIDHARELAPNDAGLLFAAARERDQHGEPLESAQLLLDTLDAAAASPTGDGMLLAEVAIAALAGLNGQVPGYVELVRPRLERLLAQPGAIGREASQRVAYLVMGLARRRADIARVRAIADDMGCVRSFRVAGPFGPRALLGFDQRHAALTMDEFADEYDLGPGTGVRPTFDADSNGCAVHVGSRRTPGPGSTYARGVFHADQAGEYLIRLDTPNSVELYVDNTDEPVARRDRRRTLGARVTYHRLQLTAGDHTVLVKLTTRHPNPVLELSLAPSTAGDMLPEPDDAFTRWLLARALLNRGDPIAAREMLMPAGHDSAAVLMSQSLIALNDPLMPRDQRRDAARRMLRRAKQLDPQAWFPAYRLAALDAADGRDQDAIRTLKADAETWPHVLDFQSELVSLLSRRQWDAEADRWIARARQLVPNACGPIGWELDAARGRDQTEEINRLLEAYMGCNASSDARYQRLLLTRRDEQAAQELDRLMSLAAPTDRARFLRTRAALAARADDGPAEQEVLAQIASAEPRSEGVVLQQADYLLAAGDRNAALDHIDQALAREPAAMADLHRLRRALGRDAMGPWRMDGARMLAEFEASGHEYEGNEVLVFDYMVTRVFDDLSALKIVHQIYKVQTQEGVDAHAEFGAPEGAYILTLHTIKADGTRVEPDMIAGKATITMPQLSPGDYIEYEWIQPVDPPAGLPGGMLGDRFTFGSFEVPFERSEMTVVLPESMHLVVDPRGPAPETEEHVENGLRVYHWGVTQSLPLPVEPGAVARREYMPSINWGIAATWPKFIDGLRDVLADRDPVDPAALRLARRVLRGHDTAPPLEKARLLYEWALENVESNRDVFGTAPLMLADRTGNRARVLNYLYGLLGIPSQLVLARSYANDQTRSEVADEDTYGSLLVKVGEGPRAVFISPSQKGTPFGWISPLLRGQDAYVLTEGAPRITVPEGAPDQDTRVVEVQAQLQSDGSARLSITETFRGLGAISWRNQLEGIPEALLNQRFEQGYASRVIAGATLLSLEITGREELSQPVVLHYSLEVPAFGHREGASWVLPPIFPEGLANSFARLDQRTTPALMAMPLAADLRFSLRVPEGAAPPAAPTPVELTLPGGALFSIRAQVQDDTLRIERRVRLPRMRIAPEQYPLFARFCRSADQAEARDLRVSLPRMPAAH